MVDDLTTPWGLPLGRGAVGQQEVDVEGQERQQDDPGTASPEADVRKPAEVGKSEGFGWRRLQVWGAAAVIAVSIIRMALEATVTPFTLIPVGIFLLGLLLLAFVPRVGSIYLALFALAVGVFGFPEISFSLAHPEAPADFLSNLLALVGVVLLLVASVPSFRQGKRPSTRSSRAVWLGALAALLLVGAAAASLVMSRGVTGQEAASADVQVAIVEFEFVPQEITAESGVVSVHVDNEDALSHTFTIDDLDVDLFVAGETAQRVEFNAPPGEYVFYCVPHPWMGTGVLRVEV